HRNLLGVGGGLDFTGCLPAVEHRQAQVHQDHVRPLARRHCDPLCTVGGDDDRVAGSGQTVLQHEDVIFIIFDVQNFHLGPWRQYAARPLHEFGQHAAHLAQHVVTIGFLNDALDAAVETSAVRVREVLGGYDRNGDVAPFGFAA